MTKDIFISHAWGIDDLGRDNHLRCKKLCDILISKGYKVWLDHYDMIGSIDSCIIKGINNTKIVLLCLTEKYCNKINNAIHLQDPNDNCFKEWNYSLFKHKTIIPIIMEKKMKDIFFNNDGVLQMYLNSTMFIDFSESIDDEIDLLYKTLKRFEIYNKDEAKIYKIKQNNSFDNLSQLFSIALKNLSPRLRNGEFSPKNKQKKPIIIKEKINTGLSYKYLGNKITRQFNKPRIRTFIRL